MVEWLDTKHTQGWQTQDDHAAQKPAPITSVGYLLTRDKTRVVLVMSIDTTGECGAGDSLAIPAVCVTKVRYLRA